MDKILQSFTVRPVKAIDLYKFCEILMEAARWFEDHGETLWDQQQIVPHTILAHHRMDELFMGYVDDRPVAAMIFNNRCYWSQVTPQERRSSLFIHKLAVSRGHAGNCYSAMMLNWACQQSTEQGYTQLMLMCNCHQDKLRRLWRYYGFEEIVSNDADGRVCHHYIRSLELGRSLLPKIPMSTPVWSCA
ncbi:GNAT family N-acetyltransferase [Celerinatantimonas yamalensis]|uniref:GNAT family N-acetyltransferase n=1 Tax=Celerinatantimonas yamalensis TaxID=559956 RepID=A0ABW9G3N6_9GAMM